MDFCIYLKHFTVIAHVARLRSAPEAAQRLKVTALIGLFDPDLRQNQMI